MKQHKIVHLRSTHRHLLDVPRFRLNTYGRRAFSYSCWPDGLELAPGFYPGSSEPHRLFWHQNVLVHAILVHPAH